LTLNATTESGRLYRLRGQPGRDADADHVWTTWLSVNESTAGADVTEVVWRAHLDATQVAESPLGAGSSEFLGVRP
jgi:hypothetical protein